MSLYILYQIYYGNCAWVYKAMRLLIWHVIRDNVGWWPSDLHDLSVHDQLLNLEFCF